MIADDILKAARDAIDKIPTVDERYLEIMRREGRQILEQRRDARHKRQLNRMKLTNSG